MSEITIEDKSLILTTHKLWKESPTSITPETIVKIRSLKDPLYQYRQDKSLPVEKRIESFDLQQQVHDIIGIARMDEKYKPSASKAGNKSGGWLATKEQRRKNCEELIEYLKSIDGVWEALSPFERAITLARAWGTLKQ